MHAAPPEGKDFSPELERVTEHHVSTFFFFLPSLDLILIPPLLRVRVFFPPSLPNLLGSCLVGGCVAINHCLDRRKTSAEERAKARR